MYKVKATTIAAVALLFLVGCGPDKNDPQSNNEREGDPKGSSLAPQPELITQQFIDSKIASSQAAIKALADTLAQELKAAIDEGGPLKALSVCHTRAPEITARISKTQGVRIKRASLKNCNPKNTAAGWPERVLRDFEARKSSGEPVETLDYSEVVEIEGKTLLRYVKAISTRTLCLNCHGVDLKPEIAGKLEALYPDDQAAGFREGDIRGAFVVVQTL